MRTTLELAPLWRSTTGFDDVADRLGNALRSSDEDIYPPCNMGRANADPFGISLAAAGCSTSPIEQRAA